MSKIDDQLAHSIYCGVWEASKNAPCTCDLEAAPAAPFAPDREALRNTFRAAFSAWYDLSKETDRRNRDEVAADAALVAFAPLLAERDALRQRAEDAEMRERAAIVKWMREWASDTYWGDLVASTLHVAADNIERGEHLLTDEARKALGEKR